MNIFRKLLVKDAVSDTSLGAPAENYERRKARLSAMTGGKGFRDAPQEPRVDSQGLTRGVRKRKSRAVAMEKVSEVREPKFMHSVARRRLSASTQVEDAA